MAEKIPATGEWEGGSKSPGRLAAEQLGDAEFGIAVAPYLDPEDQKHIDPSQARFAKIKAPLTLQGKNTTGMTKSFTRHIDPRLHPEGKDTFTFEPGGIYAMSAQDANPSLFAHEYRHDAPKIDNKPWKEKEAYNRYEDLYHALTAEDEDAALEMLADVLYQQSGKEGMSITDDYGKRTVPNYNYWMDQAKELKPSIMKQMKEHHETRAGLDRNE